MSSPHVVIQFSKDHGNTWSAGIWRELVGDTKNYLTRVRIPRIGRCQQIIFRLTFTDNAPFTLISGHIDVDVAV
jgi:hypothetical protein